MFALLQIEHTPAWVQEFFASEWALAVLLGICILEGLMMLRFMPSELVVPSALFLIGTSPPQILAILVIAVVGTTIGQVILFFLVRRGGREYVLRKGWIPVGGERLDRFDAWFDRWGRIAVPVSNTMLFVRGLFTFPAGLSEMDWRTFLALSAIGSASFQTILAGLYLWADRMLLV